MKQPEPRAQDRAIQRNQGDVFSIIGRVIPNIVHEINNPLQAIRGGAVLALEELEDSESVSNYLRIILHESDRILELTSFLRSLYSERAALPGILNLEDLVDRSLKLLKDDLNQKGLRLELIRPQASVWINASERNVQLALIELILNSNQTLHNLGKNEYSIRFFSTPLVSTLQLIYDFPVEFLRWKESNAASETKNAINIALVEEFILPHSGRLTFSTGNKSNLLIEFPRIENIRKQDGRDEE